MHTSSSHLVLAVVLLVASNPFLSAQDFERYAPKPVPPQQTPSPERDAPAATDSADDQTILLSALKGIVIRDRAGDVITTGVEATGIVPSANDLTQTPAFAAVLQPYLGQPVTMASLDRMCRDIVLYFRQQNAPVADVGVPEQDITSGAIQVVIFEARYGGARAEGNRYFPDDLFVNALRLEKGGRIDSKRLLADTSWLNQNPFRSVQPVFAPGEANGETVVVMRVRDRFPLRVFTGYEDSGNDLTGDERWFFGLNWGNAFWLDHQLNYQYTTSSDFSSVKAHSISYVVPLPWRHTLTAFAGFTDTEAEALPFNLQGSSAQAGIRYTVPLPDLDDYRHEVFAGFDWKQSDNSLEFGTVPVSATTTDIGQIVLGYRGGISDPFGTTSGEVRGFISPGGIFGHQNQRDYTAVRPGADDDYQYAVFSVDRLTRLPWNFTVSNTFSYQISNENLLPSEQMSFGGYNSIRGYDERELNNTDEGWILRNELRLPPFGPLALLGLPVQDELQFLAFWDYGVAWASRGGVTRLDAVTTNHVNMSGIGPGLRYRINTWLSVRADYGFQLTDTGNGRNSSRWHLGVVVSY